MNLNGPGITASGCFGLWISALRDRPPDINARRMTYRVSLDTLTSPSPDGFQVRSHFTQTSMP